MSKQKGSLIRGIGVVIDDHVFDGADDDIKKLVKDIEAKGFPLVKYEQIPDQATDIINNLGHVAFLIMDWSLAGNDIASVQDTDQQQTIYGLEDVSGGGSTPVIDFIKKFIQVSPAPVFVFSNQAVEDIKEDLKNRLGDRIGDEIIVKSKSEVEGKVLEVMHERITRIPSVYVLKHWSNICAEAQAKMFRDLRRRDRAWPIPLYAAYADDGDNPCRALTELMLRNMSGRMRAMPLVEKYMRPSQNSRRANKNVLRTVLESMVIIPNSSLPKGLSGCGDLYCKGAKRYLLVLSCDCDCIAHETCGKKKSSDDVHVILLEGAVVTDAKLAAPSKDNAIYSKKTGFARPMNAAYLFPVDAGKCICFYFKRIRMESIGKIKGDGYRRVGRVIAPYITDIRQRNAQWMQREGFSKIPPTAVWGCQG